MVMVRASTPLTALAKAFTSMLQITLSAPVRQG
jgi:hypothetical protein